MKIVFLGAHYDSAWKSGVFDAGRGMTRHPKLGAVERRTALAVNH